MRQKPEHVRKQYALFVSLGFTGLVFMFWIASFNLGATPEARAMAEYKKNTPIRTMTASVGDAWGYVTSFFINGNKAEYNADAIEVVGGKI